MGTNYYVKHKNRKVRQEDLHIGKRSYGWEFNFQAIEEDDYYNIPKISTKKQWFEYLINHKDEIFNEYDENISFREFIEIVETASPGTIRKDGHKLLNHYDECIRKDGYCNHSYKDEDGYNMSTVEFS